MKPNTDKAGKSVAKCNSHKQTDSIQHEEREESERSDINLQPLETHPFPPFIPDNAKVLIMGTFPPGPHRWSMEFYYPNRTNDFWKIMGMIYYGDQDALYDIKTKSFRLDEIKRLLTEKGIALHDTGHVVRRLQGNASDKFLEIVQPVDLGSLLERMPDLKAVATTGEKAAEVLAELTDTPAPKMGHHISTSESILNPYERDFEIWRMPSTSRAYPLAPAKKAEYYKELFRSVGII